MPLTYSVLRAQHDRWYTHLKIGMLGQACSVQQTINYTIPQHIGRREFSQCLDQ